MSEENKTGFSLVGIYGGTFDPIHYGHLRLAEELVETIGFHELRFVPSGSPRLRHAPNASRHHRVAMLHAAIQDNNKFILDKREINRVGESLTMISLSELRNELEENFIICFIMGADVFLRFSEWYCWRELFELCHFVVVDRPGYMLAANNNILPQVLREEYVNRQASCVEDLKSLSKGLIFTLPTTLQDISATTIRSSIVAQKSVRYLLPDAVLEYIRINRLYLG
jgi:nicotinate-nucleotide adenylyltransferase